MSILHHLQNGVLKLIGLRKNLFIKSRAEWNRNLLNRASEE
jgi:hypothetical protein